MLSQYCLIVGETTFFPAHPAERFCAKWEVNGKVKVMLITICSLKSAKSRDDTRERMCLRDIIRAELSWDLCLRGFRMVAGVALGVAGDRERVGPCSMSSRMLNQGLGLVLAP